MKALERFFGKHSDVALVLLVLGVLIVLFAPIPAGLLDFLILTNFGFAFLILLLTFYMARPVEFSTFPSLLLIATLFRLSLNVAATRLILADANAGKVISAIGAYVVGGNYVIGLIVFLGAAKKGNKSVEVRIEPVEKRELIASVTASGQVRPQTKVDVASDVAGKITRLAVAEGQMVRQGDFLLQIDPEQADAMVSRAQAGLAAAKAPSRSRSRSLTSTSMRRCWRPARMTSSTSRSPTTSRTHPT